MKYNEWNIFLVPSWLWPNIMKNVAFIGIIFWSNIKGLLTIRQCCTNSLKKYFDQCNHNKNNILTLLTFHWNYFNINLMYNIIHIFWLLSGFPFRIFQTKPQDCTKYFTYIRIIFNETLLWHIYWLYFENMAIDSPNYAGILT